MELVRGRTLGRVLQERGKISLEEAIPIFDQVLLALEAAAREQIVHRDIKPANIMVGPDQRIKVMDFGIAKIGFSIQHGHRKRFGNSQLYVPGASLRQEELICARICFRWRPFSTRRSPGNGLSRAITWGLGL